MLLLFTFEEPSSGSRTTESRPRTTSSPAPSSSEARWDTSLDAFSASTKRSFIQTSSSSCCSPYTFRVAAGSRRIGSSPRIRVTSPAMCASNRDRSRSTFAACSASVTSVPRPSSVLDVPSGEVVLDLLLAAVEVPPRAGVAVGEVREDLEVLHALALDVGHLGLERLLAEGVLPDRAAREEARGPALASDLDEPAEHVEVGARAEDDPRDLRRAAEPLAILPEVVRVRRGVHVARELGLEHVDPHGAEDLRRADVRVRLVGRELLLRLVDGVGHRFADEREVELAALIRDGLHDLLLMIDDLARGVRVEEDQELGGARAEALHLLHRPAVEELRESPVPFFLVPGGLHRNEQARPPREGEPIDRRPDAELRVEEVAARVGSQGARDPELDGLHLRVGRGLRVLRMEHLLEAPPLVHRDHREATGVVQIGRASC